MSRWALSRVWPFDAILVPGHGISPLRTLYLLGVPAGHEDSEVPERARLGQALSPCRATAQALCVGDEARNECEAAWRVLLASKPKTLLNHACLLL